MKIGSLHIGWRPEEGNVEMECNTVFDITRQTCPWEYPVIGLLFAMGGMICIFLTRGQKSFAKRVGPWLIVGFATLWTILIFYSTVGEWLKGRHALREGKASVVEGLVSTSESITWTTAF